MKTKHFSLFLASLLAVSIANAAINIETVLVGDASNPGNPVTDSIPSGTTNPNYIPGGFGSVSYNYYIGTYEVTNAQYTAFLNSVAATDTHGLYNTLMGTSGGITRSGNSGNYSYSTIVGRENNPVNYVSFWDAARFANWLTNGQPTGAQDLSTTETGMYFLNGETNPANGLVTRLLDFNAGENGVAIASENEWYKAAYYSGSGNSYWGYPTATDVVPSNDLIDPDPGNNANYIVSGSSIGNLTEVGEFENSPSHYGTYDQGGNVWEWNDTIISIGRGLRGSSYINVGNINELSIRSDVNPTGQRTDGGFRVTSLEPITDNSEVVPVFGLPWLVLLICSMLGLGYRKIRQS